jgi:hypothetical protein
MGIEPAEARAELARVAQQTPVGADGYWSLTESTGQLAA